MGRFDPALLRQQRIVLARAWGPRRRFRQLP
jgi:hypothetical protein